MNQRRPLKYTQNKNEKLQFYLDMKLIFHRILDGRLQKKGSLKDEDEELKISTPAKKKTCVHRFKSLIVPRSANLHQTAQCLQQRHR